MLTLLLVLLSHKTSSYCWRTQKCRNLCVIHAFFEGQEAWGGLLKKPQSRSIEVGSPTVSQHLLRQEKCLCVCLPVEIHEPILKSHLTNHSLSFAKLVSFGDRKGVTFFRANTRRHRRDYQ